MLDDDAFQWFLDHGGLTRANGDRFRKMVLSRGNTEDLEKMYDTWLGGEPSIEPMLKYRGLKGRGEVSELASTKRSVGVTPHPSRTNEARDGAPIACAGHYNS